MGTDGEPDIIGSIEDPLGERRVLRRGRRFDFELVRIASPSGAVQEREVVRHPGAVVIVPVLVDGRIAMIRNFRAALGDWVVELPAGTIEPGEAPARCAEREVEEETGYRAGRIESLGEFFTTPGLTDERMHAFIAFDCQPSRRDLDEDEEIEVEIVEPGEALARIESGALLDAKSMLALLIAERRGLLSR